MWAVAPTLYIVVIPVALSIVANIYIAPSEMIQNNQKGVKIAMEIGAMPIPSFLSIFRLASLSLSPFNPALVICSLILSSSPISTLFTLHHRASPEHSNLSNRRQLGFPCLSVSLHSPLCHTCLFSARPVDLCCTYLTFAYFLISLLPYFQRRVYIRLNVYYGRRPPVHG